MGRGNGKEERSSGSFEYSLDFLSLSLKTIELMNSINEKMFEESRFCDTFSLKK